MKDQQTLTVHPVGDTIDAFRSEMATALRDTHETVIVPGVKSAIVGAVQSGEMLARVRATFPARAPKGEGFAEWVEHHLPYSRRVAWGYIKAYNERDKWLSNPDATVRQLFGHKPKDDEDQATDDVEPLNPNNEVLELTPAQQKRADALAKYFGVTLAKARRYVLATAPRKRNSPTTTTAEPSLAKRTIRVPPDTDDLINNVARTTQRSYAVVAIELFEIGRKRFLRRYDLNASA
jgi:hypothetical protein